MFRPTDKTLKDLEPMRRVLATPMEKIIDAFLAIPTPQNWMATEDQESNDFIFVYFVFGFREGFGEGYQTHLEWVKSPKGELKNEH